MRHQLEFEGQERLLKVDLTLPDLNLYELNVLTRYPQRPYLIPILRERDEAVQLIYTLDGHMTLSQWLRRSAADYHDLMLLLEETVTILDRSAEHCLRLDGFCLEPTRLCFNTVKKRVELIYLPVRTAALCFEQQWNLLLEDLEAFAAAGLKPEGHELFKSLLNSTTNRPERQYAYIKVIRQWFTEKREINHAKNLETSWLEPKQIEQERSLGPVFDARALINKERFEQGTHAPAEGRPGTKMNQIITEHRHFSAGLIQYFKRLNKWKDNSSMQQAEIEKAHLSQDQLERIQTSVAAQQKNVKYRPEFEGTTLLTDHEKLQGKLVLQNQQACKIFELSKPVTRVGRNTALCDVIIEDDITIGRLHAEVHKVDQGYFLKDMDSLNGTYLNDQRLDSQTMYKLKGNDRLRLSELEILFF